MGEKEKRIQKLIQQLDGGKNGTIAFLVLLEIGKPAIPALIGLLSHRTPNMREEAAKVLLNIADASAIRGLNQALRNEKILEVRESIVDALIEISLCDASAIPVLVDLLYGKDHEDKRFAEGMLEILPDEIRKIRDPRALRKFEDGVRKGIESIKGRRQREKALFFLSQCMSTIACRKNELAKDKGVLLDDLPKLPKGNKMYQQTRRIFNG